MKLCNSIINRSHNGHEGQGPVVLYEIMNINGIYHLVINNRHITSTDSIKSKKKKKTIQMATSNSK